MVRMVTAKTVKTAHKWNLNFIYDMAKQSFETKDFKKALKLSKMGLNKANKADGEYWVEKFDMLISKAKKFNSDVRIKKLQDHKSEELDKNSQNSDFINIRSEESISEDLNNLGNGEKIKMLDKTGQEGSSLISDKIKSPRSLDPLQIVVKEKEKQTETEIKPKIASLRGSKRMLQTKKEEFDENVDDIINWFLNDEIQELGSEVQNHNRSRSGEECIDFQNEKLENIHIKQLTRNIEAALRILGYYVIPKNTSLIKEILKDIDILALKIIKISEDLDEIFVLPIKMCNLKGSLIISEDQIDYKSYKPSLKMNDKEKDLLTGSNVKNICLVQEAIFKDLINESNLFHFFKTYLKININIEKTISNKRLFFRSGQLQYKILIEPILVCQNDVGFLEKPILFPYLKNSNLHIIKFDILPELIKFIEKKYVIIESHSEQENSVKSYFNAINIFTVNVRLYSIPFVVYGFVFLLTLIFQVSLLINVFIKIGYAGIGLFLILLFYLYLKFFKRKSKIIRDFKTPYYQRELKIDETDLIIINEELSNELMDQFIYECLGKDADFEILGKIEQNKVDLNELSESPLQNENANKIKLVEDFTKHNIVSDTFASSNLKDKITKKYNSFLED